LKAGRLVRPIPHTTPLPINFVRPGRLVRRVRDGDPPPPDFGYFLAWRADSRKLRRIDALRAWMLAEAQTATGEAV
jgi:DNA-binding transcriptional LysR family regulator